MSKKTFQDTDIESWHLPHVERFAWLGEPQTIVNQGQQMVWYPRRMDLPPLEGEHEANAERAWHAPAPAREPRVVDDGKWLPLTPAEALSFWFVLAIFAITTAVWVWRTWW